jgi:LmbE family N-acetylglucosaminyl deacetylase
MVGAGYTCLGFNDLTIYYNEETKRRATAVIRMVKPDLLITLHPLDYMADHQETGRIAKEAAFAGSCPLFEASIDGLKPPACEKIPALLYADPVEHVDYEGRRYTPHQLVDVTDVIELKTRMFACHESQRSWIREQHGEDEYLNWMQRTVADRAEEFGSPSVRYAEGFTRHLGHSFPKEDVLATALGKERVKTPIGEEA